MLAFGLVTLALSVGGVSSAATGFVSPPAELFSPLVGQKVLKTAQSLTNPPQYPQYTDRDEGNWIWFVPDQWTAGFFPATLYAMHERTKLCGTQTVSGSHWLELGRAWSTGEIPSETHTGVGHDVGFLSYPFMDELKVYACYFCFCRVWEDEVHVRFRNPKNETAIQAVNAFANHLAGRFSPIVGCTRSWDSADPTDFQVGQTFRILEGIASLTQLPRLSLTT